MCSGHSGQEFSLGLQNQKKYNGRIRTDLKVPGYAALHMASCSVLQNIDHALDNLPERHAPFQR